MKPTKLLTLTAASLMLFLAAPVSAAPALPAPGGWALHSAPAALLIEVRGWGSYDDDDDDFGGWSGRDSDDDGDDGYGDDDGDDGGHGDDGNGEGDGDGEGDD